MGQLAGCRTHKEEGVGLTSSNLITQSHHHINLGRLSPHMPLLRSNTAHVKGWLCSADGKVTVGMLLQWPCIRNCTTDS